MKTPGRYLQRKYQRSRWRCGGRSPDTQEKTLHNDKVGVRAACKRFFSLPSAVFWAVVAFSSLPIRVTDEGSREMAPAICSDNSTSPAGSCDAQGEVCLLWDETLITYTVGRVVMGGSGTLTR